MAAEVIDRDWEEFKTKFNTKSQIDLNQYKPAQMQRRITNLMARHNVSKYMDFFQLIDRDEALFRYFIDYLTINVTEFFRTPDDGIFGLSEVISMGQWLSLPMIVIGVGMLFWSSRHQ